MVVLGMHRGNAYVEVSPEVVRVRMGWAFDVSIAGSAVRSIAEDHGRVWGWGVHGWRGEWLVNGSSSGLVRIAVDPPVRARLLIARVSVRVLPGGGGRPVRRGRGAGSLAQIEVFLRSCRNRLLPFEDRVRTGTSRSPTRGAPMTATASPVVTPSTETGPAPRRCGGGRRRRWLRRRRHHDRRRRGAGRRRPAGDRRRADPAVGFAQMTLVCTLLGVLIAKGTRRWASRPQAPSSASPSP